MHAYDEMYLDDAMRNLGEAFDYACNVCCIELNSFMDMFIAGGIAKQFGSGVSKIVSGISGTELVWLVLEQAGYKDDLPSAQVEYEYSREYWSGWILAYYQWHTGRSFKNIKNHITMDAILKLYPTLHEASEDKFVDTVNMIIRREKIPTRLQTLRRLLGYSQRILSDKSGVSLRMIQQYEQRAKDINKAAGIHLLALARTLGCSVEELMEPEIEET